MLIFKNILKLLFHNKVMIFVNMTFIIISTLLFVMLYAGTLEVENSFNRMQESQNGDFLLVPTISSDEKIEINNNDNNIENIFLTTAKNISEKFHINYELYKYKIINDTNITYFVSSYNGNINQNTINIKLIDDSFMSTNVTSNFDGTFVSQNTNNNFIELYNPNYSKSNLTVHNEGIVVNDKSYDSIESDEYVYVLIELIDETKYNEFYNYVYDNIDYQYFSSFNTTIDDVRNAIFLNKTLATIGIALFIIISVVILFVTFKNFIDNIEKEIGILKIISVKTSNIVFSFIISFALIFLASIMIGIIIGCQFYDIMGIQFSTLYNILISTSINTISYIFLYSTSLLIALLLILVLISYKKMLQKPLELIDSSSKSNSGYLLRKSKKFTKNFSSLYASKVSFLFKKPSRLAILFFSVFLSFIFTNLSFNLYTNQLDSLNSLNNSYNFNSVVYANEKFESIDSNAFIVDEFELSVSNNLSNIVSINSLNIDGNALDQNIYEQINNGIVIPKSFANKYSINVSDVISLSKNGEKSTIVVSYINDNTMDQNFYMSVNQYKQIVNSNTNEIYTSLYCFENCSINGNITPVDDVIGTNVTNFSQVMLITSIMLASSFIILLLSLFLVASQIIEGNKKEFNILTNFNIPTLKKLRMSYFVFLTLTIISLIVSISLSPFLNNYFEILLNESSIGLYISTKSSFINLTIVSFIILILYYTTFSITYYIKYLKSK